jgi:predicted nucleic acid-binding protein
MKLIVAESGSVTATVAWNAADGVVTGRLLYPEARAALAAAQRAGRLTGRTYASLKRAMEQLWQQTDVVEVSATLAASAGALAERHSLRGYDAVHLAAALAVGADIMVSADGDLLSAAATEGLSVIDTRQ